MYCDTDSDKNHSKSNFEKWLVNDNYGNTKMKDIVYDEVFKITE